MSDHAADYFLTSLTAAEPVRAIDIGYHSEVERP